MYICMYVYPDNWTELLKKTSSAVSSTCSILSLYNFMFGERLLEGICIALQFDILIIIAVGKSRLLSQCLRGNGINWRGQSYEL